MLELEPRQEKSQLAYAMRTDFCRIFHNQMKSLYLLAFLLTINHAQAEECFMAALADVLEESSVPREFVIARSRRAIITNAIRLTAPASSQADETSDLWNGTEEDLSATYLANLLKQLRPLERFVFVLSVLEGYRDMDCAMLLGCGRGDVMQARVRALAHTGLPTSSRALTS